MNISYLITVLFWIKTTLAGIEIPRAGCDWLSGTSYGIDIKCDGNFIFSIIQNIGKSLSETLFFAEQGENMLCTKIVLNVRNNFCTQPVLPRFEFGIFMY